ncbi:hypothetical protein Lesp02_40480 [Lentzea sp. NBRC 105346]|uniref:styrene monooxygenase/indole monooxygenase family protein n=1 Tax=Lentzea sp. NBRC 105346 TaxID=3032205 RepID=UPI0024A37918|nr:styrene monooxygenase/indole monooxygenase family protein [Lentzea sp. NBRC 105346]GLZ31860.1 hypothetical protein Lesp02_40480 [Lentzea sp. NBRC 105346]
MTSIAIVGAGQAGIVLGAGLLREGFDVTLYSDRTPDDYLQDRGRPTACLWGDSVVRERELGLNFWDDQAPGIGRIHLDLCLPDPMVAFTICAPLRKPALAVDQRLKFSRGMQELAERGADVVIDHISAPKLEKIAQQHDLVVVTTGQRSLTELFPRDDARSVYTEPRRSLFMMNIADYDLSARTEHEDLAFSFMPGVLEMFWVPFLDKDAGVTRSLVVEAMPGGPADRFGDVKTADEALDALRGLAKDLLPWESGFLAPARPTSPVTWLAGSLVPVVRQAVGVLPSGRPVLGLGDAIVLNDPLAGQGANNATRMATFFTHKIVGRGEDFSQDWLTEQFDEFWDYGRHVNDFSNVFLEPLQPFQQELLLAASRNDTIAGAVFEGFNDPASFTPWFTDRGQARDFLATHGVHKMDVLRYKLGVAKKVLSHKVFGRQV